jgi:hypothetical protein
MNDLSIRPTTPALAAAAVDHALEREQWKVEIVKELKVRGMTPDQAHDTYDFRSVDFERCRRNKMTAPQAVTNVIGSWGDRG